MTAQTATATPKSAKTFVVKRVQMMMALLSLQFVVGMSLNTIGAPDDSTKHSAKLLWDGLLSAHIIIGLSLLINAAIILYYSSKNYRQLHKTALIALLGIIGAIIFGLLTARGFHRELMSFGMAISFLIAISVYGNSLHP